jgi:ABC-type branched-subunit amino acid transport system substrate-binding protein
VSVGARQRSGTVRVALALLLLAAVTACGSRLPDEALAEIDAARVGGAAGRDLAAGDAGLAGSEGETGSGDEDGGTAAGGSTGGGTGGDGGGGSAGGSGGGGAESTCRGGASGPGVTASEVKVASIVTASGPLPGATEGAFRGASAYFAKINAQGGVCGRKLTLVKGDDGLDPQRARGEFLRLEPGVLALVAPFAVADSGYADLVASTKVPYIGTFVDTAGREAPNVFPRSQANMARTGPYLYYRQKHPDVSRVAFLFADVGGVRANTPAAREPLKKVGYEIVYDSGARATDPDFTAEVINMQRARAQMVYLFAFEVNMHVRIARNMRQQNFEPPLKVSNIGYNSKLVDLLGDVANGWSNHIDHAPMLNADEPARSPALAEFLTWHDRVYPGASIDLFPITGWANAALFVEALRATGPDVTRARLLASLDAIKVTDGGGIRAPLDPRTGETQGCFVIVRVEDRKWVREHPSSGYECKLGEAFSYG